MRMLRRSLILLIALTGLASCGNEVVPSNCVGWGLIDLDENSVPYLADNDPEALRKIIAHAEYGRSRGCWK